MADEPVISPVTPTAAPAPAPAPAAVDPNDLSKPENFDKLDPHVKSYLQKLKQDKSSSSDEAAARRAELRETQTKLAALEAKQKEADDAKLIETQQFKELYEKEKAEKEKIALEGNRRITKAEVRAIALTEGALSPKIVDLIPTDGITVDAAGNLVGVAEAVAKFKAENAELFKDTAAAAAPAATPATRATGSSSGEPTPASKPQIKKVSDMTKAEYQQYKAEQMGKLKK